METKRYYEARDMANYILEGHNMSETAEEFDVSRSTVGRHLKYLSEYGFGDNEKLKKNQILYAKVYKKIHSKKKSK